VVLCFSNFNKVIFSFGIRSIDIIFMFSFVMICKVPNYEIFSCQFKVVIWLSIFNNVIFSISAFYNLFPISGGCTLLETELP